MITKNGKLKFSKIRQGWKLIIEIVDTIIGRLSLSLIVYLFIVVNVWLWVKNRRSRILLITVSFVYLRLQLTSQRRNLELDLFLLNLFHWNSNERHDLFVKKFSMMRTGIHVDPLVYFAPFPVLCFVNLFSKLLVDPM